jgi:iron complex outermembrane receptor protein
VGLVWSPTDRTSVTVDYYHINIDDRLTLFNNPIGPAQVAQLIAAGIPAAEANLLNGSNANYFVNGFDSEVDGVDVAVSSVFELGGGDLLVDARHNFNEQKVSNVSPGTINLSNVYDLENTIPDHRSMLTFDYSTKGMFSGVLRFNYYGDWSNTGGLFSPTGDGSDTHHYGDEILVDLEARFTFGERYRITIGGENIFDTDPDSEGDGTLQFLGVRPSLTSPFSVNGAFWYARASVDF